MNREQLRVVNSFLAWFETLTPHDADVFMRVIGSVILSMKED